MKLFQVCDVNFVCSRTLTAVHDAILEDLCFPSEIVGKRIRIKLDGTRLIKVHLDKAQQTNVEHKVGFIQCLFSMLFVNYGLSTQLYVVLTNSFLLCYSSKPENSIIAVSFCF